MTAHHYSITPVNPAAHLFEVSLVIDAPAAEGQLLRLPAWIPGSYMIRDFAKNIVQISAQDSTGKSVDVSREDKSTWRLGECTGAVTVVYEVYAWDLSVRAAHLDETHGFFNGTSVFLEVLGQAEKACNVSILAPEGDVYQNWKVATSLPLAGAELYGFGDYQAADYDELIDHPVEMGDFTLATFEACGVPHDIVLTGRHTADMDRLCRDLKRICEHHIQFFGGTAPVDRYVFLTMVVGDGYGGLEHRASTALLCSRKDLPVAGDDSVNKDYRNFLGLCSHEYFHTWNVKRIKPAVFSPFDLSTEQYTRLLWAFEGITSYYDDLALVRCGLITPEEYLEQLATAISRVWRGSGRLKQSITDSSFDAWTKFYKQDENAPNAIVSYYAKGTLVAFCLDMLIRDKSEGRLSLDDLMAQLWQRHATVGVPESGIEAIVEEMIGADAKGFFEHALRSTNDLDLVAALSQMGVDLVFRAPRHQLDTGGVNEKPVASRAVMGVHARDEGGYPKLAQVFDDGAAQCAGLSAGDVIVALDGLKARAGSFEKQVAGFGVGSTVTVHFFRRDELMVRDVLLQEAPQTVASMTISEREQARRAQWLGQAA